MNVLLLLTDQQQRATLRAYGNEVTQTPNLDHLAAQSTLFENAVCAQPVCTPSRCSLLSGVYPHTHGTMDNYHPLPRRIPTLAEMVIDEGVRPGYIGKWHLGREVLPQRGFEEFFTAIDDEYTSARDLPLYGVSGYSAWLVEQGFAPDNQQKPGTFTREFTARLPERFSKAAYIAEQAGQFLEVRRDEKFFLVCSFLEPHPPYHSDFDALHERESIELPANFHGEPLENWPQRNAVFQRWAREVSHGGESALDKPEKWRDLIARYYGLCHQLDKYIGKVLLKLQELSLDDETLVIFTSDHGDMMGAHGMYQKSLMFEESQGVPLLVRHPGLEGGRRIAEPVSLVDIAPTVCDALGVAKPAHLQGESLMPLLQGEREPDKARTAVCEWNGAVQRMFSQQPMFEPVQNQCIRSIRNARWKLNIYDSGPDELYDLQNDPGEMVNRIGDPAYDAVIERLWTELVAWQRRTGDELPLQNPSDSTREMIRQTTNSA